jgi:hypothetical protein
MSPAGLEPETDCAGPGPATTVNDRSSPSSEMLLHKDYNRVCSVGRKMLVVSLKGLVAKTN